jgi:ABC-type Fe3+-hydroxamate transport system substrate-binding protein
VRAVAAQRARRVRLVAEGRPRVGFAYFIWRKPYMTANADTFASSLLEQAGGVNVYGAHEERYPETSIEQLLRAYRFQGDVCC